MTTTSPHPTTEQTAATIGLEVHAQLLTDSKMFCGCSARYFDLPPNSSVCAVCGGMPGSLPVINRRAIDQAITTALALNCRVTGQSRFDRKNYPYPDIPKGYQISQYDMPIGEQGWLGYRLDGNTLRCGITRVHVEEDTGKSFHTTVAGREVSLVDYNRSGVPLMEIVTEPQLTSPEAAREFFAALRQVLLYLGVCDGKLQEGSMRADVNVSVPAPDGSRGNKVEIKNLNSFRAVQRALEYEIERQRKALLAGEQIEQETRGWSEKSEITISQRTKEYAHDYRYFPEPDLPRLVVSPGHLRHLSSHLPELPLVRRERFQREYGLSTHTANVVTEEPALADFFEEVVRAASEVDPGPIANWMTGEMLRLLKETEKSISSLPFSASSFARLVSTVTNGSISGTAGKTVLEEMFQTGEEPEAIVTRKNLAQISDTPQLERLIDEVLAANEALVADYGRGKTKAIEALLGKVMQASQGKASPPAARDILQTKLNGT